MGCFNTKLVPEEDSRSSNVIKTVYSDAKRKIDTKPKIIEPPSILDLAGVNTPNEYNQPHKSVAKYHAKFDTRVTAKYDIKALIGRGSFSRVLRVEHKVNKQPYAIKMIDRANGQELFEAELGVLRRVKHKCIIQLVEVFDSKDRIYMVMELATGGELFDRVIAKGSFTERDATRVLQMVLEGIRYLHSLGITHRDIKPENLLYYHPGNDSRILISDFGLSATRPAGDNFMNTICGSPEYIAPEMVARKPYTNAVDMWAIGVITYILLSGTMPFDDDNRSRLYKIILIAKYSYSGKAWTDVSAVAKDFIDRLLTLDPNERLTATQALHHQWLRSHAATSSNKNLTWNIRTNLHNRASSRATSTRSARSAMSYCSNRSVHSLRSQHGRVQASDIDELHRDPEVQADLASLHASSASNSR